MNIGTLPTRHAQWRADHLAVVFEDQRLTWRQFNQRVNRLANTFLKLGISEGDKIATILPNALELLETGERRRSEETLLGSVVHRSPASGTLSNKSAEA